MSNHISLNLAHFGNFLQYIISQTAPFTIPLYFDLLQFIPTMVLDKRTPTVSGADHSAIPKKNDHVDASYRSSVERSYLEKTIEMRIRNNTYQRYNIIYPQRGERSAGVRITHHDTLHNFWNIVLECYYHFIIIRGVGMCNYHLKFKWRKLKTSQRLSQRGRDPNQHVLCLYFAFCIRDSLRDVYLN